MKIYFTKLDKEQGRDPQRFHGLSRRGFTLIEILLVMTIIIIIISAVVPAIRGSLDSVNLAGSGDLVAAEFSLARQTAMSRNQIVEVRIYTPGATDAGPWNLLALVIPKAISNGIADEWIGKPTSLVGNVIVDPSKVFSTILTANPITSTSLSPQAPRSKQEDSTNAPPALKGLNYVSFRFLSDGSTDLPVEDGTGTPLPWCLSLKLTNARASTNGLFPANNFVALVIDPNSGRVLPYRP